MNALPWLNNFAGQLAAHAAIYKASAGEVAAVEAAVDAFAAALKTAREPHTRTAPAVRVKDEARAEAERVCQPIYLRVKYDPAITDADKLALGVRPINPHRTRIATPESSPALQVSLNQGHSHVLKFRSPDAIGVAKPAGAVGIQIFRALADRFGGAAGRAEYVGTFTRNPMIVPVDPADNFKVAQYAARWINRRGETGPWSNIVECAIARAAPVIDRAVDRLAA